MREKRIPYDMNGEAVFESTRADRRQVHAMVDAVETDMERQRKALGLPKKQGQINWKALAEAQGWGRKRR